MGNPVILTDPNGMSAVGPDDYFDVTTGEYLGSDKQFGVKTDNVRTITKDEWNSITGSESTSDKHKALALRVNSKKLSYKAPISETASKGMANHYYQEAGYDLNDLKGSSVEMMGEFIYSKNEYGHTTKRQSPLANIELVDGKLRLRVDKTSYGSSNGNGLFNRWDFMSLFDHERGQHGKDWLNGVPYNKDTRYGWEKRAYHFQINVNWETFQKTSPGFQNMILENAAEYGVYPLYK